MTASYPSPQYASVLLQADPTAAMQAATKNYVDSDPRVVGTVTFEQYLPGQTPDTAFPLALAAAQNIRAAAIASGAENPIVRLTLKGQFYKFQSPIGMTINQPGILIEPEHTHCEIIYANSFISTQGDARGCGIAMYICAADVTVRGLSFRMPNGAPAGDPNTPTFPLTVYSGFGAPLAAIFICGAPRCTIDDCIFPDGNQFSLVHAGGSLTDNQTLSPDLAITNCTFWGVGGALVRCFDGFKFHGNRSRNIIVNNAAAFTNPPHQLYVSDRNAAYSNNLSIIGCMDENNQSAGNSWKFRRVNGVVCSGNAALSVGRGIMSDTCTNVVISNNTIIGLYQYNTSYGADDETAGIEVWNSPGAKVHGNLIVLAAGADVRAIRNRSTTSITVTGQCSVAQTDTTGTTIICPSNFSTTSGFYVGCRFYVVRGSGVGQSAVCTAYSGATQVATFATASFSTTLDTTSYVHVFDTGNMQGDTSGNTIVVNRAAGNINPVIDVLATDFIDLSDNVLIFATGSAPLGGPFIYCQTSYGVRVLNPRCVARAPGEQASFLVSPFNFTSLCGGVTISLESLRWPLSSSPATINAPSDSSVTYDYGRDVSGNLIVGSGSVTAKLEPNDLIFSGNATNYIDSSGSLQVRPSGQFVVSAGGATYLNSSGSFYLKPGGTTSPIFEASATQMSFFGSAMVSKPTVSGAWGGNTAGKALSMALASLGLITDSTTA